MIESSVTDPHGLFLRLWAKNEKLCYATGGHGVVPCTAFWRHDFFMLIELRGAGALECSSVKGASLVCISR